MQSTSLVMQYPIAARLPAALGARRRYWAAWLARQPRAWVSGTGQAGRPGRQWAAAAALLSAGIVTL